MISYNILIAAICTLLIILYKIYNVVNEDNISNDIFYKIFVGLLYVFALFFWILSIFEIPVKWYGYALSGIISFIGFIYYYFVYLYNKKENDIEENIHDYNLYIGKKGVITSLYGDGYIGKLFDTNEMAFINSNNKLEINEIFLINEIKDGKIYAVKNEK